jgi:hypothetical protein
MGMSPIRTLMLGLRTSKEEYFREWLRMSCHHDDVGFEQEYGHRCNDCGKHSASGLFTDEPIEIKDET